VKPAKGLATIMSALLVVLLLNSAISRNVGLLAALNTAANLA